MNPSPASSPITPEADYATAAIELLRETVIDNPYVPAELHGYPFPSIPQAYFLTLPVKEALYGGAAGGGKSAALLAAALQYVHVPGYSAILFRRTLTDLELEGSLIPMSHDWLAGTDAEWDGQLHQWWFPKTDAVVAFGYMKGANDHFRYKSAAFQTVGFDELTTFLETPYRFLFARLRKPEGMPVPLRMLAASNPGDVGHEWVKDRFQPHLPRHRRRTPGREFVPARLEDNPGLDRAAYEAMLDELDPVTQAQMKAGDWGIRPDGNLFKREWFEGMIRDACPPLVRRVRFWDFAATEAAPGIDPDYTATVLMGMTANGQFWVEDADEFRATPADVESRVRAQAYLDGRGVEVHLEQEPGSAGKAVVSHYQRSVLPGYAVYGAPSTGDKVTRAKPFSAACQNGLVWLVRGTWVAKLIDRLTGFGLPGVHDDLTDAADGAHRRLTEQPEPMTGEDWGKIVRYDDDEGGGAEAPADPDGEPRDLFLRHLRRHGDEE